MKKREERLPLKFRIKVRKRDSEGCLARELGKAVWTVKGNGALKKREEGFS